MNRICYSSEVYHLAVEDLENLADSPLVPEHMSADEIILLIGRRRLWLNDIPVVPDTLLKGRQALAKAKAAGEAYVPVRVAFESRIKSYDIISPMIRTLRYKYTLFSSNIYHINPQEIRAKKIERNYRTPENAYCFSNPKYQMSEDERRQTYENLRQSMLQNGFDDRFPLDIMLCRNMGVQDTLNQGHHRMGVALECGIKRVAVEFCAAGQAPEFLHPLCRLIAGLNLKVKHFLSKLSR